MSEKLPLGPTPLPAPSGTSPVSLSPISRTQFDILTKELFAQLRLECVQQIQENIAATTQLFNQQFQATNSILTQELARIHNRFDTAEDRTTLNFTSIDSSIAIVIAETNIPVNDI